MKRTCSTCQKSTWWGCGQHIPGVMDALPESEWCTCGPKKVVDGKEYPPKQGEGSVQVGYDAGGGREL